MDAVALVVEQNFPELHSCFCGLQHTCFSVGARRDVARVHTTANTLNGLGEFPTFQSLAVLEGPVCDMYRVAISPDMRSKSKLRPPTSW